MAKAEVMARSIPAEAQLTVDGVQAVVKAINTDKPKEADMSKYRALLIQYPDLWRVAGDLAEFAADKVLREIAPKQTGVRESVKHGRDKLMAEMGHDRATGLERALIEHVGLCWLHLQVIQLRHAQITSGSVSINQAQYWERCLSMTQARYLRAVETLARVRRLLRPGKPVQVNIATNGGQQVNVSQLTRGEDRPE